MFDAVDQQVDFRAHCLGDGAQPLGGHVLRPDQPHGGLVQGFRNLAHVGGPPQQIGGGPYDRHRNQEQGDGLKRHNRRRLRPESASIGYKPGAPP
ncbi:MAG: hypothetical protein ACK559_27450 [bacterium]